MPTIPGGVWPAMFTPLADDGTPNLAMVDRLAELLVEQGMDGLYVLGSTGHGPALRLEHRRSIAERIIRTVAGRIPVMVHVGCVATEDAIELAQAAADAGADAISSVPPIYFPAGADATFMHYSRIAAATSLPFYCYHLSILPQLGISTADYARRVLSIPHIGGMKITDRDLYMLGLMQRYTGGQLTLYSGADELICHAVLSGAAGAIGTFYNLWGPVCRRARQAMVEGDLPRAARFMSVFQGAIDRILASGGVYQFCRQAMQAKYGIDIGPGRAPYCAVGKAWDEPQVREVIDTVDAAA